MKQIPLTQGKTALVDDGDFEKLSKLKWRARKQANRNIWYAFRTHWQGGKKVSLLMHRVILCGVARVDHRDSDGLNNQRVNLRSATCSQNNANSRKTIRITSSRFKGVFWHSRNRRWVAIIRRNGKLLQLGSFGNEVDAAKAYDVASHKVFGEFARPNFAAK